ncbi:MAG: RNA polymerase sigma factor [Spirochaetales bacterium]|nr:RNA polymerase sigma factor [Spirochaetales bacterium]
MDLNPYIPRLYKALYLMVQNEQDASDLLQDTLLRAYEKSSYYDPAQPLYPWLLTLGRNIARNHFRKKESHLGSIPEELEIQSPYLNPEENLLRDEESRHLMQAIENLSPEHREIIELKHFQECSYQEIGTILELPPGTVMSRLYYARKELGKILSEGR